MWASQVAQWLKNPCQCSRHRRWEFDLWVGKIPWRKKWQPTPVFLPGKSPGQRSLTGYCPRSSNESDTTEHRHTIRPKFGWIHEVCSEKQIESTFQEGELKVKGRESLTKGSQWRGRWKRIELKSAWNEKEHSVEMKKQASWEEEKGNRKKWDPKEENRRRVFFPGLSRSVFP